MQRTPPASPTRQAHSLAQGMHAGPASQVIWLTRLTTSHHRRHSSSQSCAFLVHAIVVHAEAQANWLRVTVALTVLCPVHHPVCAVVLQLRRPACKLDCAGTAKGGGGDFACGKCDGTSADGRRQYSSKAGATSCSLCPVGSRVNAAHTVCISYPPGTQPGPGNARRPCPAGALPAPLHHIIYITILMILYIGMTSLPAVCE